MGSEYGGDEDSDDISIRSSEDCASDDELDQLVAQKDDDLLEIYAKVYGHELPATPKEADQSVDEQPDPVIEASPMQVDAPQVALADESSPSKALPNGDHFAECDDRVRESSLRPDSPKPLVDDQLPTSNAASGKEDNLSKLTSAAQSMLPTGLTLGENDVETEIPPLLRGKLRDYQHIGLNWLVSLDEKNLNGILADEMGLGKTIQTIALLAHLACAKETWGPHLIVVPTSVLLNWDLEFKKWLPGFKVIPYYGSQKERKERRRGWSSFNAFHVVVTSYNLAIADARVFKRNRI